MDEIALYQTTLRQKDPNSYIEKYAPLVKRIAYHMMVRLPNHIQLDDLIQSGMLGLLNAFKNFDANKGASFNTYAGIRIRGAILDDMRRFDWVPRSVHRNSRRVAQAIQEVEKQLKRDARDKEIADKLELSLDDYYQLVKQTACSRLFAFEEAGINDNQMTEGLSAKILGPDESFQNSELKKELTEKIARMPKREQLVLALYYEEELNLKEMGEVLGVRESRACQLLSQANARLRSKMEFWTKI